MTTFGSHSESGTIKRLLLKHARDAFVSNDRIEIQWRLLNYLEPPDFQRALDDYDKFIEIFRSNGIEISFLPPDERTGLDSVYVRDAALVCSKGAILCNMGKQARQTEPEVMAETFRSIGLPVLGSIQGDGRLEGGDVVWLNNRTVAVGEGYRSNAEGISQFRKLLGDLVDEVIAVPLPHWDGPEDVLHLMSFLSPVDVDLAVVYSRLMPVPFRQMLLAKGIGFVEVPDGEFMSMGCNVLAIAPRKCVVIDGNPITRSILESKGAEVISYDGREISLKGAGGPTCLTRPLLRED